jgi:hypothetical protein
VIAAYRIRGAEWFELMITDPTWAQTFYPTNTTFDIRETDVIVGMCTYRNDEDRVIKAGHGHKSEMCNVYLMYYAHNRTGVKEECFGSFDTKLEAMIPYTASVRPSFNSSSEQP